MGEIFSKYKNIIIVLVVSVAAFVVYSIFFAGKDISTDSLLGSTGGDQESVAIGKEFLTVLLELKSIDLSRDLFDKRSFLILRDFSQEVAPQPTGRPNPFSPIGVDIAIPDDVSGSFDFGVGVENFSDPLEEEGI